jgi:ketosteroid isomerase-like protein
LTNNAAANDDQQLTDWIEKDMPKRKNAETHQHQMQASPTFALHTQSEREVQTLAMNFLKSFEDLDMPTFIACFADGATAFFPSPEPPLRVVGKAAIQERFEMVFAWIRKSASGGPPYHRLQPRDLYVQIITPEAALISFHLLSAERTARRTLVVAKADGQWRILHLHASNGQPMP